MEEVMLRDFAISPTHFAEVQWGRPCKAKRTNRRGIRYYECVRDGGYVVDTRLLEKPELNKLSEMIEPKRIKLGVQIRRDGNWVIGVEEKLSKDAGWKKPKRLQYDPALGEAYWVEYPVFVASNSDSWCIVEKITGVRTIDSEDWDERQRKQHDEAIEQCYQKHSRKSIEEVMNIDES